MYKIPKKESETIQSGLSKFQKVLGIAKARDLNESDTVSIITDMLAEIFGYDKYLDITSEFAIRGTYCDLAVKLNGKVEYLIECKSIGTQLKEAHIKQAVDYGANQGVNWVVLTNGENWRLYKIRFEQPISADLVYEFDMSALSPRAEESKELLYILHKDAIEKNYRQMHYEKTLMINPYTIAQILLSEGVINAVRKEVRKLSDDLKLAHDEVKEMLSSCVIKRDLIESDEAKEAEKNMRKIFNKLARKAEKQKAKTAKAGDSQKDESSPVPAAPPQTQPADANEN